MTEYEQMVLDCAQREERLTDLERSFIDSVGKQLREGRALTTKQADRLDDIWERATERG